MDFNKKPKADDKGLGKIRLDETPADTVTPPDHSGSVEAAERKKILQIYSAIGGAALLSLAGVFAISAGKDEAAPTIPPTTAVEQATTGRVFVPAVVPAPTEAVLGKREVIAASIAEKNSVILRREDAVYKDDRGDRAEAYLDVNGRAVASSGDFATHVSLFNSPTLKGAVSILITEGPYAGTRLGFYPTENRMTYEKVGETVAGADGKTPQFKALPHDQRSFQEREMKTGDARSSGVVVPDGAYEYQKTLREKGEQVTAFWVKGTPAKDGVFRVMIWNEDSYTVNLKTGDYSIGSVFTFRPNYEAEYERTGIEVDLNTIPIVNGVLPPLVAPAMNPAPTVVISAPATAPAP